MFPLPRACLTTGHVWNRANQRQAGTPKPGAKGNPPFQLSPQKSSCPVTESWQTQNIRTGDHVLTCSLHLPRCFSCPWKRFKFICVQWKRNFEEKVKANQQIVNKKWKRLLCWQRGRERERKRRERVHLFLWSALSWKLLAPISQFPDPSLQGNWENKEEWLRIIESSLGSGSDGRKPF